MKCEVGVSKGVFTELLAKEEEMVGYSGDFLYVDDDGEPPSEFLKIEFILNYFFLVLSICSYFFCSSFARFFSSFIFFSSSFFLASNSFFSYFSIAFFYFSIRFFSSFSAFFLSFSSWASCF